MIKFISFQGKRHFFFEYWWNSPKIVENRRKIAKSRRKVPKIAEIRRNSPKIAIITLTPGIQCF
jgi:hypothetical protein